MADRRLALHDILISVLGSHNVYFQPPASKSMSYPCIVYNREKIEAKYANNSIYNFKVRYSLTLIDPNPDSIINEKILKLPLCSFDRHYASDNLNHDVYNIYY